MFNRTTSVVDNPLREQTPEDIEAQQRQDAITTAVDRRARELMRAQYSVDPDKRLSDAECFHRAQRDIDAVIRRDQRRDARAALRADVSSMMTRNDHLVGPVAATVAYGAVAEAAAVAVELAHAPAAGAAVAAGTVAAGISTRILSKLKELPSEYWSRFRAGVAAGCALCAAAPLVPWEWQTGVLAALGAAGVVATGQYRADNAPSYPPMGGYPEGQPEPETEATSDGTAPRGAQAIIDDWNAYVANEGQLAGAAIEFRGSFARGWRFTVTLVRAKKQKFSQLVRNLESIAVGLNIDVDKITPEKIDQSTVVLTITTSEPDNAYTGPVVGRDGGDVYIEVGPYSDGDGAERFTVFTDQLTDDEIKAGTRPRGRMQGGFSCGTTGSGKSRLNENIAVGLKKLGVFTVFLDPQNGKSSKVLMDNANWPLSGVNSADGRAYGNVRDLLAFMRRVSETREYEAAGDPGFQHTRERPGIMVIIEECQEVFNAINPDTGRRFGADFEELDRKTGKNGIRILSASQEITQDTFGRAVVLRDSMTSRNAFLLSLNIPNRGRYFPGYDGQDYQSLPPGGYGYNCNGQRPHSVWRNRFTEDLEPFFAALPEATLDYRALVAAGDAFAKRHEAAEMDEAKRQDFLARLDAGDTSVFEEKDKADNSNSGGGVASVLAFPIGNGRRRSTEDRQQALDKVTTAQQRVLDVLREVSLTASQVGGELGISREAASRHLRALKDLGLAGQMEDGRWMAKA